jgi:subtilisin family serine protease
MADRQSKVQISVFDHTGKVLEKAKVTLEAREQPKARKHMLKYLAQMGCYEASDVEPGRYTVTAKAPGYSEDERPVQVDPAGLNTVVILGTPGLPFLYRGDVKTPFEPHEDLLAVALESRTAGQILAKVQEIAHSRKLSVVETGEQVQRQHVHVFRFAANASTAERERTAQELSGTEGVTAVGPLVRFDKGSLSLLTNELVVKFRTHVSVDQVPEISKRFSMVMRRRLPQAGNAYLFQLPGPVSYRMLETAAKLVESGLVEYAEPNLISTVVDDAINPTDFLYPMQWHLPLIHCPDAWQAINDNISPSFAFGSPTINIAVVDSGVDTGNPDFTGNVSNGSTKVYQAFDFQNMVANNSSRQGGHGTCCAGISTALPNNPSGVMGQDLGVSGSAGNCRLIAVERPFPGSEVAYSDMYIWTAGFDPHSSTAGFPAAISPGADVMTNSFGYSIGMAISGLMKDTMDFLTTYGREGRGVLMFFSAGNSNMDFTLQRPWAAYTRTFATAASSLALDGVTEIRSGYSNFGGAGRIDFCAPSDRTLSDVNNPPQAYGTMTVADRSAGDFPPDAPSHATAQTTTSAAVAPGATSLAVVSSAGFVLGQLLVAGTPGVAGREVSKVTGIPDGTHLNVTPLLNVHGAGTAVFGGPSNSFSKFGGTSSATPLAAGVGALLISVRPLLTWVQVRDILRGTAVHIDAANIDPVGIWTDVNGTPSNVAGYLGPFYSRWYGSGRIDALAAINEAIAFGAAADVVVRENLGDNGSVPSVGTFWNSPDIWVRNLNPGVEGAAALPANYVTPGPTQDAAAAHDNYIYVRAKNNGPIPTSTFYVRVYLTHWAGTEFIYPDNFIPTNHPGQPLPSPLAPGTYLIGEVQHDELAPNATAIVNVVWPAASIPPQDVVVGGMSVHWHPCLLVEISPQDGPLPTGSHVWDNNNLAQKNITINYADDDGSFVSAMVVGNLLNRSELIELVFDRTLVPADIELFIDVLDPKARAELRSVVQNGFHAEPFAPAEVVLLEDTCVLMGSHGGAGACSGSTLTLPRLSRLRLSDQPKQGGTVDRRLRLGHYRGREVFWLESGDTVKVLLRPGRGTLVPILIGGQGALKSGSYLLGVTQFDADSSISGAAAIEVRIK